MDASEFVHVKRFLESFIHAEAYCVVEQIVKYRNGISIDQQLYNFHIRMNKFQKSQKHNMDSSSFTDSINVQIAITVNVRYSSSLIRKHKGHRTCLPISPPRLTPIWSVSCHRWIEWMIWPRRWGQSSLPRWSDSLQRRDYGTMRKERKNIVALCHKFDCCCTALVIARCPWTFNISCTNHNNFINSEHITNFACRSLATSPLQSFHRTPHSEPLQFSSRSLW